jgi:hypothetical protein
MNLSLEQQELSHLFNWNPFSVWLSSFAEED